MDIQYLGHSCFLLKSGAHKVILDPFLSSSPTSPLSAGEAAALGIDAVLVSHAHADHWGDTLDLAAAGAQVIATYEIAEYARERGADAVALNIGGQHKAPWGRVRLTPAWHSSSFPDGSYGGMPCGLVVEMGGKRLYFAGDTCKFGDMALIGEMGLDAALLPVGDTFTMGPQEAASCLELLKPALAIPMHHSTFEALTGDPHEFVRLAEQGGYRAQVMQPEETLSLE